MLANTMSARGMARGFPQPTFAGYLWLALTLSREFLRLRVASFSVATLRFAPPSMEVIHMKKHATPIRVMKAFAVQLLLRFFTALRQL